MPMGALPALPSRRFLPFSWQKTGLLTLDIREFPMALGWRLIYLLCNSSE
jgi:hypothetical protein